MNLSILEYLDRIPPRLCRQLARVGRFPLTNEQIAVASGLTIARVSRIAKLKTWASVPVGQAEAFRAACGVTHLTEWRQIAYLKRAYSQSARPLSHLDKLPPRMLKRLAKGCGV